MDDFEKFRICLVSMPSKIGDNSETRTGYFINPLTKISKKIILITGNIKTSSLDKAIITKKMDYNFSDKSIFKKILYLIFHQIKMSFIIFKKRKDYDIIIFRLGGPIRVIPLFISKLIGKKILLFLPTTFTKVMKVKYKNWLYGFGGKLIYLLSKIILSVDCLIANKIVLLSSSMKNDIEIFFKNKFAKKFIVFYDRYIDTSIFYPIIPIESRDNVIGYIGRLSKEKGILNLLDSFSQINNYELHIIGSGDLYQDIIKISKGKNLQKRIKIKGQLSHKDINKCLNQFKLLVLPSYSEGLPTILLEAMASGTPTLCTPVGGIQDIIIDGKNGFIMENNSVESIKFNINRVLNNSNLKDIENNALEFIKNNYSYKNIEFNYSNILKNI